MARQILCRRVAGNRIRPTPSDVMSSPDALGTTLLDSEGQTYRGERDDVNLAFDENGSTVNEHAGNTSIATAQALGVLPGLAVPNTLPTGTPDAGTTFTVRAIDVVGIMTIPGTDFYSFVGSPGAFWNFAVMSVSLEHISDPIPATLSIYDSNGNLLATSHEDLETSDPIIYDLTLPTSGTYYVTVSSPTPGDYELFAYSFAANEPPFASGDTIVGNTGNDTVVGNTGTNTIVFPTLNVGQPAGNATVLARSGADVIDLTQSPTEQVYNPNNVPVVTGTTAFSPTLQVEDPTVNEGQLLKLTDGPDPGGRSAHPARRWRFASAAHHAGSPATAGRPARCAYRAGLPSGHKCRSSSSSAGPCQTDLPVAPQRAASAPHCPGGSG